MIAATPLSGPISCLGGHELTHTPRVQDPSRTDRGRCRRYRADTTAVLHLHVADCPRGRMASPCWPNSFIRRRRGRAPVCIAEHGAPRRCRSCIQRASTHASRWSAEHLRPDACRPLVAMSSPKAPARCVPAFCAYSCCCAAYDNSAPKTGSRTARWADDALHAPRQRGGGMCTSQAAPEQRLPCTKRTCHERRSWPGATSP
jgi:hypothetical protein